MPNRSEALGTWLKDRLKTSSIRLEPASSDASFRRYFRLEHGGDTLIVMDAPPDKEDCLPFIKVSKLLLDAGLNVPKVLACDPEQGFVLLTDLGVRCYLQVLNKSNVETLYRDAMDALFTMQSRASTDAIPPYDESLLRAELALFTEWFLSTHLGIGLSTAQHNTVEKTFSQLCRSAREQPQVFVHRDFHSRNLMYDRRHNPGILDFQDAVKGPVTYDLVSLLRDVYVCWSREQVERWARRYHVGLAEHGIVRDEDSEQFLRWFDLMGAQRHLKIAGIFARLYHRDGKPSYLRDIPLTLNYVVDVCSRYPELESFSEMLEYLDVSGRLQAANADAVTNVSAQTQHVN